MIDHMIQSLLSLYPLLIKYISWDGDVLNLAGTDWNFNTLSAWRIAHDGKIQFACWDEGIGDRLKELEGLSIVRLRLQSQCIQEDPVFELSDGRYLEYSLQIRSSLGVFRSLTERFMLEVIERH